MNINELVKKYNLTRDEAWQLPQNKNVWILKHDAVEKIGTIEKITIDNIQCLHSDVESCRLLITATKDKLKPETKTITTIGEASKNDCTSKYYGCMAEKRGIDRVILKLIKAYEYGIYSESESDEFKKGENNE